jgi:hypothetical protein
VKRQPKGTPKGGQFAEGRKPDGPDFPATGDLHLGSGAVVEATIYDTGVVRGEATVYASRGVEPKRSLAQKLKNSLRRP